MKVHTRLQLCVISTFKCKWSAISVPSKFIRWQRRKEQLKTKVIELPVSSSNFQSIPRKKELSHFYGLGGKFMMEVSS